MLFSNFSRIGTLTAAVLFTALPIGCSKPAATDSGTKPAATDGNKPAATDGNKPAGAEVTLSGAGATFPQALYERYAREIRKDRPEIKINYQGIGSGGGIKQTIAGTVDFGASDAAMSDEEIGKVPGGVILVPTAGGAVSVVYNLPGVEISSYPIPHSQGSSLARLRPGTIPKLPRRMPGRSCRAARSNKSSAPTVAVLPLSLPPTSARSIHPSKPLLARVKNQNGQRLFSRVKGILESLV
jgi:PBP superfamily domain